MKLLITGAGGLVGRATVAHCVREGVHVVGLGHADLDIADVREVDKAFAREHPEIVINCAAWTDVDGCELDHVRARKVNAEGPECLAVACRRIGALLITISTDYIFDGEKDGFYTQRDQPNPQSVYAVSKLEGERRAHQAWARTIVVRSGYIFGVGGKNFVSTVLARARRGEPLRAIRDCYGTPTFAVDLARQLYRLAELDLPGTYHVVNSGGGSSFEGFARAALRTAGLDERLIQSISLDELNRPAARPRNSRLRCLLSEAAGLEPLPHLDDALREFVKVESPAGSANTAGSVV